MVKHKFFKHYDFSFHPLMRVMPETIWPLKKLKYKNECWQKQLRPFPMDRSQAEYDKSVRKNTQEEKPSIHRS